MTDILGKLAGRMGVLERYQDQTGLWHDTSDETRRAILSDMGLDVSSTGAMAAALADLDARAARRSLPDWMVVVAEAPGPDIADPWHLTFEDGTEQEGQGALPVLPLGIHQLAVAGDVTWLLAAPPRLPEPPRTWGVTLPLYGLATAQRGGVGSYGDLADAIRGLGALGAGFVGINPIHAGFPGDPMAFSPYAPSSRRRFSTLHIDAGATPPAGDALIDYPAVLTAQSHALRAAHAAAPPDPAFDAWRAGEGADLARFVLHQALSEVHGPYWPHWPATLHDPASPDVAAFGAAHPEALAFHAWAQWRAERQLAGVRAASDDMALGLYLDLAVGTHPEGAETWGDPDLFARSCSLGAPPDAFSKGGQRWNLAPMRPEVLARTGFRALSEILRAQLRFARVLRIDHILGFDRAYWVPQDAPGAYVAMPKAALLAVVRIEAARVGASVIGEDLGNIPKGLHDDLEASGILGCRVAIFEQDWEETAPDFHPAARYTRAALTSFSTHDLPTFAGWRVGRDIDWRCDIGMMDPETAERMRRQRTAEVAALERAAGGDSAAAMHAFLAETPSRLVAVQAEDALGLVEQPNLPGTMYEHPNWRRRLGVSATELADQPGIVDAARSMTAANR